MNISSLLFAFALSTQQFLGFPADMPEYSAGQQATFVDALTWYNEGEYDYAYDIWHDLASNGSARAQYAVAVMYELGQGREPDYELAVYWYQLAAEQGYALARNNLGMLFEDGIGVEKNDVMAKELYEQAAIQGVPSAQYNLAILFYKGIGTEQNLEAAAAWLMRAADSGLGPAQYNLGVMFTKGQGVEQDAMTAARWFIKAEHWGPQAVNGMKILLRDKPKKTLEANTIVLLEPKPDSGVVGQAAGSDVAYVLKEQGDWSAVYLPDSKQIGWTHTSYLK